MRRAYVVAAVCAALAAGAGQSRAQQVKAAVKGKAAAASPMVKGAPGAPGGVQELQAGAVAAAEQAERLSHGARLERNAIREQGLEAQGDLRAVMQRLKSAEQHATAAERQHIAAMRGHEQEALKHVQALCDGASKDPAMVIAMHAQSVIEHARAAETAMHSVAATDSWLQH